MNEEYDDIDLKSKLDAKLWKRILKYLLPYKKYLFLGIAGVLMQAFLETKIIEFISQQGIEKYIESGFNGTTFSLFVAGLFGLIVLDAIVSRCFFWACSRLEWFLYSDMTNEVYDHLQGLSYSFFDKYSVGWLMARTTSDTSKVGELISWGFSDLIWCICKLIFIFITMLKYSVKLSLVMAIAVPTLVIISYFFRKIIVKYFWRVRKLGSQVTSSLNEGISGAKTSKVLVIEDKNSKEFDQLTTKYKNVSLRRVIFTTLYYQSIAFLSACGIAAMCYFGGVSVIKGTIEVSVLFLFISYSTNFFEPVLGVARTTNDMKHAQVSASRICNLLDVKTEIPDSKEVIEKYGTYVNPKKENWEELKGNVRFENVSFKYTTGSGRYILENFNLNVEEGKTIAIVGETGAGKSTIVNLLCRFYEPTSGTIYIDGKDYKERSVNWLHSNLGYVMQTPHLFSGTIKENIRYGNMNATDEEIIAAAKAANADDFINKLENGYNTEVGEGGNRLSQGQKQLISFARAIVANPRIIVLDEATSSIDTKTEALIQKAISNILKGRTSFVIAHRLSTIVNADTILVIQQGKITEEGTHKELMKLKGYYYKLYTNQFIDEKMSEMGIK